MTDLSFISAAAGDECNKNHKGLNRNSLTYWEMYLFKLDEKIVTSHVRAVNIKLTQLVSLA